jgi:DNA-binding CsgD family transcriptional regulator
MPGYTLSDGHLRKLREVVEACAVTTSEVALPWEVFAGVADLLHCDEVVLVGLNLSAQSFHLNQSSRNGRELFGTSFGEPMEELFWRHLRSSTHQAPWIPELVPSVTKPTDFMSDRQWRALPLYVDFFREGPVTSHELMMCLPDGPGRQLRLVCWRNPGPDFTEDERFDLQLLTPHIQAAYRRGERRRHTPGLTPRQCEILALVGAGYTNGQVGRSLGLSEATVRTHLNNIYLRLGVRSRTEAVTRFLGHSGPIG